MALDSLTSQPGARSRVDRSPTIKERLECGNLTVDEVCVLASRGKTGFYADLKAGLVEVRKMGRKTIVPGPSAKRYIDGLPPLSEAQNVAA